MSTDPLLIAFSQQRKKHLHFIAILLHIAQIVQDQASDLLQLGNFLGQAQFALGCRGAVAPRAVVEVHKTV